MISVFSARCTKRIKNACKMIKHELLDYMNKRSVKINTPLRTNLKTFLFSVLKMAATFLLQSVKQLHPMQ